MFDSNYYKKDRKRIILGNNKDQEKPKLKDYLLVILFFCFIVGIYILLIYEAIYIDLHHAIFLMILLSIIIGVLFICQIAISKDI